jgi:MFS family permease
MLAEFGWTRALISGGYSFSQIIRGISGILMGGLNDKLGPRVVITICGLLLGLGYILMSRISTAWQFYLFYVLIIGVGMGGLIAPQLSTVARWFISRRSVMTGFVISGGGVGGIFMPLVINWLILSYGWRDAYIVVGVAVLVSIVVVAQFLRRDPASKGLEPYRNDAVRENGQYMNTGGLSMKEAISTRQFWMSFMALFCFGFYAITIMVHIVPHVTDLGFSADNAAGVMAVMGGATLAGSIITGITANRIGSIKTLALGFVLETAALVWLLFSGELWMLYVFAVAAGIVNGGITTLQSPLIAELFGIRSHGLVLGICNFGSTVGSAIGPFLAGYIFDVTDSYRIAFYLCTALGVVGLTLASLLRPVPQACQNENQVKATV